MSDIEGKVTRVGASECGQRASFNGANGMSEIEGKAAREAASECGQRASFNGASGRSDPPTPTRYGAAGIEGKVTRVGASERGVANESQSDSSLFLLITRTSSFML